MSAGTDPTAPLDSDVVRPRAARPPGPRGARRYRDVPVALGVFVGVLLALQVFLLTVGVDGLLADDERLAWITAVCSIVLAAGSAAFYRYLR